MPAISLQSRLPRTYRIVEIHQETPEVRTLAFAGSLGAKPGQFVMVWIPGVDEIPLGVAYDDGAVTKVTFFMVGDATKALAEKKVGDLVGLRGPFGTCYEWRPGQHIALVAGGYGAAPMYFVARETVSHGCTMEAIVGARSKEHLLYVDQLSSLPHVKVHIATNDGSAGRKGFVTDILEELLSACPLLPDKRRDPTCFPIDQIFTCGPEPMLVKVSEVAAKHQVPSQLALARYMKCGFGLCGQCVVDPLGIRICTEGPVVKNEQCLEIKEFGKYARDSLGRPVHYPAQKPKA